MHTPIFALLIGLVLVTAVLSVLVSVDFNILCRLFQH